MIERRKEPWAVVYAGGRIAVSDTLEVPKALVPVANRALLSYPLRTLQHASVTRVFVVCEGDAVAAEVQDWLESSDDNLNVPRMRWEVASVDYGSGTVAAIRSVIDRIHADDFIFISGDFVAELPIQGQILTHQMHGAAATVLLASNASASNEAKKDSSAVPLPCIGIGKDNSLEMYDFFSLHIRQVQLPITAISCSSKLQITMRLLNTQTMIFKTEIVRAILDARTDISDVDLHLLPYFVRHQKLIPRELSALAVSSMTHSKTSSLASDLSLLPGAVSGTSNKTNAGISRAEAGRLFSAVPISKGGSRVVDPASKSVPMQKERGCCAWKCLAYVAPDGSFCRRANTLQNLLEINLRVLSPDLAPKFLDEAAASRLESLVSPDVVVGMKSSFGNSSMCGTGCSVGDKSSIKRSVLGDHCEIGNNVRVINSLLMEGIKIGERCTIQNSILFSGCTVLPGAQLKDCQIGPKAVVPSNIDLKDEIFTSI